MAKISKTKIEKSMNRKTNPELRELILKLKKKKSKELDYFTYLLSKPRRKSFSVNLEKINKFSKEGDIVVVPGKILGKGEIKHKITVAAFSFSQEAMKKLKEERCEIKNIIDIAEKKSKFKIII